MIAHPLRALASRETRTLVLGSPTATDLAQPDRGSAQVSQRGAAELGAGIGSMSRARVGDRSGAQAAQRCDPGLASRRCDLDVLTCEACEVSDSDRAQIGQGQVCSVDIGVGSHADLEVRERSELEREPELSGGGAVRRT